MGREDDPTAVVHPDLRVRGISGVRVCDASVMPRIQGANTNAPAMAIADRCVDLMMSAVHEAPWPSGRLARVERRHSAIL